MTAIGAKRTFHPARSVVHPDQIKPVGHDVALVDSAEIIAKSVEQKLRTLNLLNKGEGGAAQFFATDAPDRFAHVGEIFLGEPMDPGGVKVIGLQIFGRTGGY